MNNFYKRVLTSIVLILLLIIGLFNNLVWLLLLTIISLISFFEFKTLIDNIWKENFFKKTNY